MENMEMVWEEVVSLLQLDLNEIQLKNWILPLRPIAVRDGTLYLDAQSSFIKKIVKEKYQKSIEEYYSYISRQTVQIVLLEPSQTDYYAMMQKSEDTIRTLPKELKEALREDDAQRQAYPVSNEYFEQKKILEEQREENGYHTLNPKYTMESFVRGPSNEFAYATALGVIKNPGIAYNPLFIYGGSGLGKTHLMQAIAHAILKNDLKKRVLYITSEMFMNEMIAMIENGTNQEKEKFRHKYRSIDVLLIDDIQFIAGKKATMEEIFHTFNDLKEANKQIVLSSDKPPKELKNLEDRLVTRFEGGMTADIQPPDFETRVAILNHKMRGELIELPPYAVEFIAAHVTTNIRELEGSLLRVIAFLRLRKLEPPNGTEEEIMACIREAMQIDDRGTDVITMEDILRVVTRKYGVRNEELLSKSRQSSIAFPRQVAMYLARKLTDLSLVKIGSIFDRDHSTVMHAIDKISEALKNQPKVEEEVSHIETLLRRREM